MRPSSRGVRVALVIAAGSGFVAAGAERDGPARPASDLRRPLTLPNVARGTPCPRSSGHRRAKGVGIAVGDGPVFAVLGLAAAPPSPAGVAYLSSEELREGQYYRKTLWASSPQYAGPILVRGKSLRSGTAITFSTARRRSASLFFPRVRRPTWRYFPAFTVLPGGGCYGIQVDGTSFSRDLFFEATVLK